MPEFIREARADDRSKLEEIIDLSFPRFFRFFAAHSLKSPDEVLVSTAHGNITGFVKLVRFQIDNRKYGCILWLAVHPSCRRRGVGSSLVKAGREKLVQSGALAIFASIQRTNKASLATFGAEGFVRIGFIGLLTIFGWNVFIFYRDTWFAPGEIVVMFSRCVVV